MTDDELDQRVRAAVLSEQLDTSRVELAIRDRIRRRHVPGWAVAAAAVMAMLLAGVLSYRTFLKEQTPPICVAAAHDHEREIIKAEPRQWLTTLSAIESLAEKQGVPASAIAALDTTGYSLERGRLCFLNRQIFLHLVYTRNGDEISVYLKPRGSDFPLDGSVRQASIGPEDLAYFQTDRLTAVFVDEWRGQAGAFARAGAKVL
jgi:hypothetical protein